MVWAQNPLNLNLTVIYIENTQPHMHNNHFTARHKQENQIPRDLDILYQTLENDRVGSSFLYTCWKMGKHNRTQIL